MVLLFVRLLIFVGLFAASVGRSLPKHRSILKHPKHLRKGSRGKLQSVLERTGAHISSWGRNEITKLVDQNPEVGDIYEQDWVKKEVEKGRKSELERWAMFNDDGQIKKRVLENPCEDLKDANRRVKEYPPAVKHISIFQGSKEATPRILCWVFSTAAFHKTKAEAVRMTWGKRCDGLLFFSNLADPAINAVKLLENEHDSNDNLWYKLQKALVRLEEEYFDDYDWFYKADDDTHCLVENLRRYLLSDDVKKVQALGRGAFVGRRMNNTRIAQAMHFEKELHCTYMGGGPGYLFDKEGLRRIASSIKARKCLPDMRTHSDDLNLGHCAEVANIPFVDTRDKNGGERFHVFEPEICTSYVLPPDLKKAAKEDWYYSQTFNPKERMAGCSPESVAFHHFSPQMMIETDAMWYQCPTFTP